MEEGGNRKEREKTKKIENLPMQTNEGTKKLGKRCDRKVCVLQDFRYSVSGQASRSRYGNRLHLNTISA